MKPICVALLMAGICFTACKKTSSPETLQTLATFQPMTTGSQWTYQVSESLNPSSSLLLSAAELELGITIPSIDTSWTSTLTATDTTEIINGLQYTVLTQSPVSLGDVYTAVEDSNYYSIGIIPAFSIGGVGALVTQAPILYLKDTTAGASWVQTIYTQGTTDTTTYNISISTVGGSRTVNGKSYSNVTHEVVKALPGGVSALAGAAGIAVSALYIQGDYYFARGVGLIELDINSSLYGFVYTETLTSATIK